MERYKQQTADYYDKLGNKFGSDKKGDYWNYTKDYLMKEVDFFLENLNGKRILDLGSGPGRDSLFFREKGFFPICADISFNMMKVCHDKGLVSCVMDIENLGFAGRSFDGVWAYASLLFMPKRNLSIVLDKINELLFDSGLLSLGMKEGNYDGYHVHNEWEIPKYIAYYSDDELREILTARFDIIHFSRVKPNIDEDNVYLNYLCRKK